MSPARERDSFVRPVTGSPLRNAGAPPKNKSVNADTTNSPDTKLEMAAWLAGYRAAIADAMAIVDALGGPGFHNLSAPVLLRVKARLADLEGQHAAHAA